MAVSTKFTIALMAGTLALSGCVTDPETGRQGLNKAGRRRTGRAPAPALCLARCSAVATIAPKC